MVFSKRLLILWSLDFQGIVFFKKNLAVVFWRKLGGGEMLLLSQGAEEISVEYWKC